MEYLFSPTITTVNISGLNKGFPVHRIYCVGKNYADHAREMGGDPSREAPFFFSKPADAAINGESTLPFPGQTTNLHHEVELVVAIGRTASAIDVKDAQACIFGYAVGIDLTRRDLQATAKAAGRPWDIAKGFDHSAPLSDIRTVAETGYLQSADISLTVNGELRQRGNINNMIWSVSETIAALSHYFALQPGDLVFTGTPAGVGQVQPGDELHAAIEGIGELNIRLLEVNKPDGQAPGQ